MSMYAFKEFSLKKHMIMFSRVKRKFIPEKYHSLRNKVIKE